MSPQKKNYGGLTTATCCFLLITILSSLNVVYSARMARNKDEVTVVPPNHHYLGNDGLIATKKNIATAEVGGEDEISQAGKELLVEVINNNAQTMADLNQDDPEMLKKIASVNGIKVTQDKKTGKNTYSVKPEGKSVEDLEKILNEVDKFSTQKGFAALNP